MQHNINISQCSDLCVYHVFPPLGTELEREYKIISKKLSQMKQA